jgi:hypothetical protein
MNLNADLLLEPHQKEIREPFNTLKPDLLFAGN